jgi:hypothetical protein
MCSSKRPDAMKVRTTSNWWARPQGKAFNNDIGAVGRHSTVRTTGGTRRCGRVGRPKAFRGTQSNSSRVEGRICRIGAFRQTLHRRRMAIQRFFFPGPPAGPRVAVLVRLERQLGTTAARSNALNSPPGAPMSLLNSRVGGRTYQIVSCILSANGRSQKFIMPFAHLRERYAFRRDCGFRTADQPRGGP